MVLGSHNSWTFACPKKWWMRLIAFTARCQNKDIISQYESGVRCFDLRVRFKGNKVFIAHGVVEYDYDQENIFSDLSYLNVSAGPVYVRVCHDIRKSSDDTVEGLKSFANFCKYIQEQFPNIVFFGGENLLSQPERYVEYDFKTVGPSIEEKYASVCKPRIIDDWFPWFYAWFNNDRLIKEGTDKDVLMLDFVF